MEDKQNGYSTSLYTNSSATFNIWVGFCILIRVNKLKYIKIKKRVQKQKIGGLKHDKKEF